MTELEIVRTAMLWLLYALIVLWVIAMWWSEDDWPDQF